MSCVSEETLLEFIEGRLSPEAFEGVEQHLSQCETCRELVAVATPAGSPDANGGDESLPSGQPKVGRYEILSPIGAGGMGVVYAAHDPQLDRKVALKMLRPSGLPGVSPQELRARILREGRAMALLSHPNVLTVYDVGELEDQVFVAMELAEGGTVASWLREQPRSWREVLDVFLAGGRGLAAAHAKGLVHRDFKPENILFGGDGRVLVTDFGVAQLTAVPGSEPLTSGTPESGPTVSLCSSALVGSPAYMAPEQMRGEQADVRADLFSFCVSLYEALYGERPFAGETVADLQRAVSEGEVRLPPNGTRVPAWIHRALLGGLRAEPGERPQMMEDLLGLLSRQGHRWPRAVGPTLALLAGIVVVPLAGALFLGSRQRAATPNSVRSIAVLPFVNAVAETEFLSDGITESLINSLSQAPELQVMARTTAFQFKGKELDPRTVGQKLGVDAVVTGRALQEGNTLLLQAELVRVSNGSQLWGKRYNRKLTDVLALQEELAKAISDELRPQITVESRQRVAKRHTDNTEAYQRYLQGRYLINKRTAKDVSKGCEYFQQATAADPNYALAYAALAECYSLQGVPFLGGLALTEVIPRARAAAAQALVLDDALAEAHAAMGHIKMADWDWLGGESEFQRAIALNPSYATAHQYYSLLLTGRGRHDEAVREMKRAVELDPLSLIMNNLLGFIFRQARQSDRAIKQGRMTVEMDPGFAGAHQTLGLAYEQKGMNEQAIAELETAVALSGGELWARANLGHVYAVSGRRDDAQKILDELKELSVLGRRYVSPCLIATVLAGLGDKDQAFDWLEKSYQERASCLTSLRGDSMMDNLRSDARFTHLLRRMNFPE